jgi:hypothetical protein
MSIYVHECSYLFFHLKSNLRHYISVLKFGALHHLYFYFPYEYPRDFHELIAFTLCPHE